MIPKSWQTFRDHAAKQWESARSIQRDAIAFQILILIAIVDTVDRMPNLNSRVHETVRLKQIAKSVVPTTKTNDRTASL